MNSNFLEEYQKLNASQKLAVDEIEGCVMVVAGPGTGKTQVLGARIANILLNTDTNPENILCLTFTEAATVALRKRLIKFIGSIAYRVNIHTYHGFCNTVIQENKDLFGNDSLKPISELENEAVLNQLIDRLPNSSKLKRFGGDAYYEKTRLKRLFSFMQKEDYSSRQIEGLAEESLKAFVENENNYYKRNGKGYKKGDLKQNEYNKLKVELNLLKEAASYYSKYKQDQNQVQRYDFADMINWVFDQFENKPELLLQYQERYQYFLVDEYQDTNGLQNKLLFQLIDYWENPNAFVVGDDDQSIYKFQGANVENIFEFYLKYEKHIKLFVLDENYRSSQNILDGSNAIIKHNTERITNQVSKITKDIKASNPTYAGIANSLFIVEYKNTLNEEAGIVNRIEELKRSGVELSEIAILYTKHNKSEVIQKILEVEGVDFNVVKSQDILKIKEIQQVILFLRYLSKELTKFESGDSLLFEILHFNNFKHLTAFDIASIGQLLYRFNKDNEERIGWRTFLNKHTDKIYIPKDAKFELRTFVADVEYWLKEVHNLTLQGLIEQVLAKMGFVSRAMSNAQASFQMQCLSSFFNFVKEETSRNPYLDIAGLLNTLDLLVQSDIGLKLSKVIYGNKGVNLMTVHGSKGLEFEYVFLMRCTYNAWDKKGIGLPYSLGKLIEGEPESAHIEEGRRLFYVALTRAKKGIEVSYPVESESEKELVASRFVAELEESKAATKEKRIVDSTQVLNALQYLASIPNTAYQKLINQDFVDKELAKFSLNATNLNSYLHCPVAFFYQNIVRVPASKNEFSTFGSAIHQALEGVFKDKETLLNKEKALSFMHRSFEKYMNNNRETLTREAYDRRLYYGKEVLNQYYEEYGPTYTESDEVVVEEYFNNCECEGVPIKGRIDKIIISNNNLTVVDYKTGKASKAAKRIKPPISLEDNPNEENFEKRYGGDYWRQIMFYRILLESHNPYNKEMTGGIIDMVEPEKGDFAQYKIMVSNEDLEFVKKQVKTTYTKIMNKEFENGCEEDFCEWCKFNNYYNKQRSYSSSSLLETTETLEIE